MCDILLHPRPHGARGGNCLPDIADTILDLQSGTLLSSSIKEKQKTYMSSLVILRQHVLPDRELAGTVTIASGRFGSHEVQPIEDHGCGAEVKEVAEEAEVRVGVGVGK